MLTIENPILPGFHPDPCLLCVGEDYYIATSSFEWWPGVPLYHSRDLANWDFVGYAVDRKSQLDMRGNPDSGGVWAPALSYADGRFWLVYSNVRSFAQSKDVENYVISAPDIRGPWSEPVAVHGRGFDPSLFHDDDGQKWLVSMIWDPRPRARNRFAGIEMQKFVPDQGVVGEPIYLFEGSNLKGTEGPHILKHNGWYYLILAEGGTGYHHAMSIARSRNLKGPYELSPVHPLFCAQPYPENPIQKTGHGSIIQTPDGEWYASHLCSRPVLNPEGERRCILGRETGLQKLVLRDDEWFELEQGGSKPSPTVTVPATEWRGDPFAEEKMTFASAEMPASLNTLREPADPSWLSLTEHPGSLRLRGRMSILSLLDVSLVGRRLHHLRCSTQVELDYAPNHFQQTAGLALYYNTDNFRALKITWDEEVGRCARLLTRSKGERSEMPGEVVALPDGVLTLRAELDQKVARFFVDVAGETFAIGPELDATTLSDEDSVPFGFTGTFAALFAEDATGFGPPADFQNFAYAGGPTPVSS